MGLACSGDWMPPLRAIRYRRFSKTGVSSLFAGDFVL